MLRQRAPLYVYAVIIGMLYVLNLTQERSGVVIAVADRGMATVRIGEQEQTVLLPEARVGDQVICTAPGPAKKWECTVHKL